MAFLNDDLGIYLHWPFCRAKCPYCDFNSHVRETIKADDWRDGLLRELDHYAEATGHRRIETIFFGGGTPSLMPPETVSAILMHIRERWPVADEVEITLEANPTSVEKGKLRAFREAGINRLSLGIQSLRPEALRFLGREHSAGEAVAAIQLARELFSRYSFDLIYARPDQTVDSWKGELAEALALVGDHFSLYQLTIEEGTPFHRRHAAGEFTLPPEEESAAMYALTAEMLAEQGLRQYEISNYAKPGFESRHNLRYWRYQETIGIGPGAHGRLAQTAIRNIRTPEAWLASVAENGHGMQETERLNAVTQGQEAMIMGLRLAEGLPFARMEPFGLNWDRVAIERLEAQGLLRKEADRLRLTPEGYLLLDAILPQLTV